MAHSKEQYGSDDAPSAALVEDIQAILHEAFDAEFCCWLQEGAWRPVRANSGTDPQELPPSWDLPTALDRCVALGQPVVSTVTDNQHLLVVPITLGRNLTGAAVGTVGDTDVEVIHRISKSVLRTLDATHTSHVQQGQLDAYARHLSQAFEELAWLRDLTGVIEFCDATREISTVAANVLPTLCDVLQAESLALVRVPADTGCDSDSDSPLEVICQAGQVERVDDVYRWLLRRSSAATAGRPIVENCLDEQETFACVNSLHSYMLAQITKGENRYGWLVAVNKQMSDWPGVNRPVRGSFRSSEYEFGTFETGLMQSAAVVLATQARNAQLFRDSESMFVGVIHALSGAIDAKDRYTCGHSDRVARIARRLAEELGLDTRDCERIYVAGLLHDIGKIGIPDEILMKPGKLTDDEFEQLKKHPVVGSSILEHLPRLEPSLPGVLHHHERIDGTGYPSQLAGAGIPLPARIIAVADAYDAMTSCRPYRDAMSLEKAEAILRENAGMQWDVQVVNAFFETLPDIRRICTDATETSVGELAVNHFPTGDAGDATVGSLAGYAATANEATSC